MYGMETDDIWRCHRQPRNTALQKRGNRCLGARLVDFDAAYLLDHADTGLHVKEIGEIRFLHTEGVGHAECLHNISKLHLG